MIKDAFSSVYQTVRDRILLPTALAVGMSTPVIAQEFPLPGRDPVPRPTAPAPADTANPPRNPANDRISLDDNLRRPHFGLLSERGINSVQLRGFGDLDSAVGDLDVALRLRPADRIHLGLFAGADGGAHNLGEDNKFDFAHGNVSFQPGVSIVGGRDGRWFYGSPELLVYGTAGFEYTNRLGNPVDLKDGTFNLGGGALLIGGPFQLKLDGTVQLDAGLGQSAVRDGRGRRLSLAVDGYTLDAQASLDLGHGNDVGLALLANGGFRMQRRRREGMRNNQPAEEVETSTQHRAGGAIVLYWPSGNVRLGGSYTGGEQEKEFEGAGFRDGQGRQRPGRSQTLNIYRVNGRLYQVVNESDGGALAFYVDLGYEHNRHAHKPDNATAEAGIVLRFK
ncbi:hypothetical protein HY489_02410 [Candidatus Woesearchaeota archaeon]|nr:hypothetical protein [Candidatus Woesearchaeota archaeon]